MAILGPCPGTTPVEANLPDEYIPDVQLRLLFYKRLSSAVDHEQLYEIYGELKDRFGTPPKQVEALKEVFEVKLLVRAIGAQGVDANHTAIVVNIGERSILDPPQIVEMVTTGPKRFHLRPDMRLVRYLNPTESEKLIATTKTFLEELGTRVRRVTRWEMRR